MIMSIILIILMVVLFAFMYSLLKVSPKRKDVINAMTKEVKIINK